MSDMSEHTPRSVENEQAVLGGLLQWPERLDDLSITEADFYTSAHREIFASIRACIEQDGKCDMLLVADRLNAAKRLDDVGGLPYLLNLREACVTPVNIKSYAKRVIETAQERGLLAAAGEIAVIAQTSAPNFSDKLARAQALLMGIETSGATGEAQSLRDALKQMIERVDRMHSGTESSMKTGFADLDAKIIGLGAGDMVVVAGRPAMGKTAFALQIATNVAEAEPVLVFSLEMGAEQLAMRQAATVGKIDLMALRSGNLSEEDWNRLTYAMGKLKERPMFIDDRGGMSMHQIRARARQTKRRHGLGLIVVDYIQLIHGDGNNRVDVVSEISRGMKAMARELGVPVIALSQLSRKVEDRTDKRPQMSDLRESGAIEQDADLILMLYRDDYYFPDTQWKGVAECIISKQRSGPTGMVPLTFIAEHAQFADFAGRYEPDAKEAKKTRGFN